MARLVQNGDFPFQAVNRNGTQKRYLDTPQLRQWCSERREAKAIRAKMARQTSKLYRGRHWHHLIRFSDSVLWMLRSGRLNDPREIDYTLTKMGYTVGVVAARLRAKQQQLHRSPLLRLRRRETDNLR